MNKKVKFLAVTGMAVACSAVAIPAINASAEGDPVVENGTCDWSDILELGRYSGYKIDVTSTEVTSEEIDMALNALMDAFPEYAKTEDTVADWGDCVRVSYRMLDADGRVLSDFCADDVEVVLSEDGYPDDFRKGIIGMKCGETRSFNAVLPDNFYSPGLRGKLVKYLVNLKSVDVMTSPEVTDDWIAEVTDYASIADWRADKKKEIYAIKKENQELEFEEKVLNAIVADCTKFILPAELIDATMRDFTADDVEYAEELGISLNDLVCDYYNFDTVSDYYASVQERVVAYLKEWYVKKALVNTCGITITDEDLDEFVEQTTDEYDFESTDECIKKYGIDLLREECEMEKTWQKVLSQSSWRVA